MLEPIGAFNNKSIGAKRNMEKTKTFFAILGLGISIGVIVVVVLVFIMGARPQKVDVGGVEFEIPTPTPKPQISPTTEILTTAPSSHPTLTTIPSPKNQCQWLETNFPQSSDEAKAKYNLPSDTTFQFIYELCPSAANAFAFKANSTVEIQVPSGGCIDSWSGFTDYVGDVGTPVEDGHGGWRVYKGTVRAPEMTVRTLGCNK